MNLYKYLFFIINYIIIFINISLFLISPGNYKNNIKINNKNNLYLNKFRSSDYYIINLINKSYFKIAKILENTFKYTIYIKKNEFSLIYYLKYITKSIIYSKKKILIYSVDLFSFDFHKKWLKNILKDKYIIKYNKNNPDYLIYNVLGTEHLNPKYNNSIKIAIFTENKIPDFYEADYTIGHYHITYLDRYFKYSIFFWQNLNNTIFSFYRNEKIKKFSKNNKFCAALISNNIVTDGFRIKFINELNKYKKIDMAGNYNNNIGRTISNKIEFLKSYKFSISMENTEGNGYLSEKIIDSFMAGTIPIYYGDYMVDEFINPKTYILIRGENDILSKINYIKKIDNDDKLYKSILKEKVLIDENIKIEYDKELKNFLLHIFNQEKSKSYRKNY